MVVPESPLIPRWEWFGLYFLHDNEYRVVAVVAVLDHSD